MTDHQKLIELAVLCEKAEGPDREYDLAIKLASEPNGDIARIVKERRGFDRKLGMAWDLYASAVCFEKHNERGDCFFNGSYPLPAFSASLDAALTLVPEGKEWNLHRVHDDYNRGKVYFYACIDEAQVHYGATPALALCVAALRARAEIEES
jgi:hypothetical protein